MQDVEVDACSGYMGEQEPRALTLDGRRIEAVSIVRRWREPDGDFFRVLGSDGRSYVLRRGHDSDTWQLVGQSPPRGTCPMP